MEVAGVQPVKHFLPSELLSLAEAPHRLGLRSSVMKSEENQTKFASPIDSRRQQYVRTALSLMISQWDSKIRGVNSTSPKKFA